MELETTKAASTEPEAKDVATTKIQRKSFLKAAAAGAAAMAAGGVVAPAATAARAASRVEVVNSAPSGEALIWVQGNPFAPAQVAAFNKLYPNVRIKQQVTTYVPTTPSLSAHLVSGVDVPDGVFFIEDAFLGQYAPVLYDVSKYVAPYANSIAPYKLAVSKQGGRTVGIAWDVDPVFLIYRMDLVDKAGVDITKIVTYDDLIAAAQQVKAKVPTCTGPIMFMEDRTHLQFQVEAMAWQQHTGIADAHGHLNLLHPAYTKAFNYLEKVAKAGLASHYLFQTPSLYNAWNTGKTCFLVFADWFTHWNEPGLKPLWGKIGLAKQPVFNPGKDSHYSMMGGSAYVVPLKAKRPDLGALFGTFQLFEPAALRAGNASNIYEAILPAAEKLWPYVNLDNYRHKRIINKSIPEHELLVTAARNAPPTYRYPPWYSQAFSYYAPPVLSVIEGKMTAAQAQKKVYNDVLNKVVKRFTG